MSRKSHKKLYTLSEACDFLSISTATGRNWMKSGRLISSAQDVKKPLFEENALLTLRKSLLDGTTPGLKNRRNKTYVSGSQTYASYIAKESNNHAALKHLMDIFETEASLPDNSLLFCLLRHCAEQLIMAAGYENTLLFQELLDDLVSEKKFAAFWKANKALCEVSYTYYPEEDTLGFLYMSLYNMAGRKASGSYYTPCRLAKRLIEKHLTTLDSSKTILDPSCGTGVFLMQLPKAIPLKNLYGSDLNPTSITLTRINLALKYHISTLEEIEILKKNIIISNFLQEETFSAQNNSTSCKKSSATYDIILGNPPWGARLSAEEKRNYQAIFFCATGSSMETYDLFIEQSLRHLTPDGILAFVLPEALLNVKSHMPVRELLLKQTAVLSVEYLGEVFEQVHCPSIILTVAKEKERPFFQNVSVSLENGAEFSTRVERTFHTDNFAFSLTDEEYLFLQKLLSCPNHVTLADNAVFALGIVTGNNKELLSATPAPGLEPVVKGCDISKYHINSHSGYLSFTPEKFQQTAPEELYRAPEKLFYRFINKQLVFAYDNTGLLSLNSCNILIPKMPGLSIKYVLAVLNSSAAQFVFEKKFHSVKVLRSHLAQLPIPLADTATQEEIVSFVDILMSHEEASGEYQKAFSVLDQQIARLFGLTQKEYETICT